MSTHRLFLKGLTKIPKYHYDKEGEQVIAKKGFVYDWSALYTLVYSVSLSTKRISFHIF